MSSRDPTCDLAPPSDHRGSKLPSMLANDQGSDSALLDLLRARLNPIIDLRAIAAANHGHRFAENLTALVRIADSGVVDPVTFGLREVLSLTSYTRPNDPNETSSDVGMRGHMQRAFACAVLLRESDRADVADAESLPLAPLIESCIELGDEYCDALSRDIIWRLRVAMRGDEPDAIELALLSLAFLILACDRQPSRRPSQRISDAAFSEVFDWAIALGDDSYNARRGDGCFEAAGLRLNWVYFGFGNDIWRKLAKTAFIDRNSRLPASLQETARLLGETLLED